MEDFGIKEERIGFQENEGDINVWIEVLRSSYPYDFSNPAE